MYITGDGGLHQK